MLKCFGFAFLVASFVVGGATASFAADKPITFKLSHTSAPNTAVYETYEVFKKSLEKYSDGKVKVQVYPQSQLGSDVPATEAVLKGAVDMSSIGTNNIPVFTELYFWAEMPFMFKSSKGVHQVYGGEIGNELKQKLEETTNLKCLFYPDPGNFRNIMNAKREVVSPKDMEGLKFRTGPSPVEMDTVRAIGGSPTPINWSETYMALEQKVVDGSMQHYQWAFSGRHQEVVRYLTELPAAHAMHLAVMNKEKFYAYPKDIQEAILKAADDAQKWNFENTESWTDKLREKFKEAGVAIRVATPEEVEVWREAAITMYPKYADKVPQSFIDRVRAAQD